MSKKTGFIEHSKKGSKHPYRKSEAQAPAKVAKASRKANR